MSKKFIAVDDNGTNKLIKLNGKLIEVDISTSTIAGGLKWISDDYANLAEFGNTAPDYSVVKADTDGSGASVKGTILMKVPGPEIITFATVEDVLKYYLLNKADINTNTEAITALEAAISLVEKTWTGSLLGTVSPDDTQMDINLSTLVDKEGNLFDFSAGSKLELDFGLENKSTDHAAKIISGGAKETYHILSPDRTVDVSFKVTMQTDGHAIVSNFNSHGTTIIAVNDVRLVAINQANPTGVVDLTKYQTKLTKTITLTFDDGTTEDIKVG